jgi:hypothetical protein
MAINGTIPSFQGVPALQELYVENKFTADLTNELFLAISVTCESQA